MEHLCGESYGKTCHGAPADPLCPCARPHCVSCCQPRREEDAQWRLYQNCCRSYPPPEGAAEPEYNTAFPACNMCDVMAWGENNNTFILGYTGHGDWDYDSACASLQSDGVTLDMSRVDGATPTIRLPNSTITGLEPRILFYEYGRCLPNEFSCSFGLYEAARGASLFTLIPESKLTYETIVVPTHTPTHLDTPLTGLRIRVSRDRDYVLAFHHTRKLTDTNCGLGFCIYGRYSWIT